MSSVVDLAKAADVSLEWLATGKGDRHLGTGGGSNEKEVDIGFLVDSLEEIDKYRQAFGVSIEPLAHARAACLVYQVLKILGRRSDGPTKKITDQIFQVIQEKIDE